MNKIIYLIVGCFCCVSCGDFLKEYSKELVYATSCRDLDEVLIGDGYMDHKIVSDFSSSLLGTMYYVWLQVMDDDVEEYGSGNYKMDGASNPCTVLRPFYSWNKVPFQDVNGKVYDDETWKMLYRHIGYLNVVISQVKEFTHDPEEMRNRVEGEALFLRGANYFLLVNLYASPYMKESASKDLGVPLNVTEQIEDEYFSRNSVAEVYAQIVDDLKKAADKLAGIEQTTIYRVNEKAARVLLSRVYLYMGEWQLALDECDKVLERGTSLWDLNDYVWKDIVNANDKLDIRKAQYMNSNESPEVIFTQGSHSANILMYDMTSARGRYRVSDELRGLYHKYEAQGVVDLRSEAYFSRSGINKDAYFSRKTPRLAQSITAFDAFIIRTAEVYLNKAEAEAMLDKDAVSTLKHFMKTRFKDNDIPSLDGLSGEDLVKFIREERRRELCFECQRWFDLRRYAVYSKYPETKEIHHNVYLPVNESSSELDAVYDGMYTLKRYGEEKAYVMPIPGYEIVYNNGNLVDNPERDERSKQ